MAGILKGLFDKVVKSATRHASCFTVFEIERILKDLDIDSYEFVNQSRVVKLSDERQLARVLSHVMPSYASSGVKRAKVGCWQFEVAA